ncbi:uncharacterized protein A1O9_05430 [Exophiala aquamarina CBS 119918]|uniref:Major facilitator superfamily (MFS) profile domain-containing protein n=1 Tax=Exophiala aquamarina CBS 119918 TaxID=1182545 RepID=A0A072PDY2_9EURO|nr:uncharacterized protein A1O9_05430 [Exophiala aquamarina CBS 119918]KEF57513.1 hypothetical protein A1O9_05430 [Exophiala aquamarina CBS 119918]
MATAEEEAKVSPGFEKHLEQIDVDDDQDIVYDDTEHEPELHFRTWIALASMFLYNYVIIITLLSPPTVLSYIGASLGATDIQTWVLNSLTLPQAVFAPLVSSISDVFQIRKGLMLGLIALSFIGAAIAPGSQSIYRLIGAQILISFGFSAAPLGYAIPSEILPRKWRPMGQVWINIAAGLAACTGPLIVGALTKADPENGWRKLWWIQMGLWGASGAGILIGYRPPKRHSRLDHLQFWQKIQHLDLIGYGLFAAGLSLFLVGLSLGGGEYPWTNARTLGTLITGLVVLVCFGLYEWKGTSTGFLHHDLFRGEHGMGRTFAICVWLIFAEAILLFPYVVFYPVQNSTLFEEDPFLLAAREQPFWLGCLLSTPIWGLIGTRLRRLKEPMSAGFLIFTGGIAGLATIQPDDNTRTLIFAALAGTGFGAIIIMVIAMVQFATPHHLIATATAVTVSSRSVGAAVFTAIYAAAFSDRLKEKLPSYVAAAASKAGLPQVSLQAFVAALAGQDQAALLKIEGVNPAIISAGVAAAKQASADSVRVVFMIAAPFGIVAAISCWFTADMRKTMNYRVDAPVENLTTKIPDRKSHNNSDV